MINFIALVKKLVEQNGSHFLVMLSPHIEMIPIEIQRYDEPFLPFGKAIVNATRNHVVGYVFDLPAYMALGAVGLIALERTIDYVRGEIPTILHGNFALSDYHYVMDENSFGVNGVTIRDSSLYSQFVDSDRHEAFICIEEDQLDVPYFDLATSVMKIPRAGLTLTVLQNDFVVKYRGVDYEDHLRRQIEELL